MKEKTTVKIEYIAISEITPYKSNPRKNNQAVDAVAESIRQFGFRNPILLDRNNEIVCGHTRIKAAIKLGMAEVPCIRAEDLTDEQVKAYRLADNKTGELASWDDDLLSAELTSLDLDMSVFGFDLAMEDDAFEDDFDVKPPETPTTEPSDIWQLGRHRLMCGDATCEADAQRLFGDRMADMVFIDPPYNVDYVGKTKDALKIANDKMSNTGFYRFLLDSFTVSFSHTKPGGAIYVCHADSEGLNFRRAMLDSGYLVKQVLVWAKNTFILGRQDYHWQHEPILYGWKPGAAHYWCGDRKQSTVIRPDDILTVENDKDGFILSFNVGLECVRMRVPSYDVLARSEDSSIWLFDKPNVNREHPTMKPIGLCARAIRNSSKRGELVADFFGGSGPTLIASEQLGRTCYLMELDPRYCDVIVKRFINQSGSDKDVFINRGGTLLPYASLAKAT